MHFPPCYSSPATLQAGGRIGFGSGLSYSPLMRSIQKKINVINVGSRAFNAKPFVSTEKWIVKQSIQSIPPARFKRREMLKKNGTWPFAGLEVELRPEG